MTGLESSPVVVRVFRGGVVESVHHGIGVISTPSAAVGFAVGDPTTSVLPRSALKPLQAVAALRAGAQLDGAELAVACASHAGEPSHLAAVRSLLTGSGVPESALANPEGLPSNESAQGEWVRSGRAKARIAHMCSGNHAAMLAACGASGWPTEGYLDPQHPHQRLVAEVVSELAASPVLATAVDGCGAPVFAIPLVGLARAFGRIASAPGGPERQVADAMRGFPHLVAGTGCDTTALMRAVPGLIAKDGAEGVYAAGLPDGIGIALKISDGADRARAPFMAVLLARAGIDTATVQGFASLPMLVQGRSAGVIEAVQGV